MTLPIELAEDVIQLALDDRFKRLMKHWLAMEKDLTEEILQPLTPAEERELLVNVRARYRRDVTNIVNQAHEILSNQKKLIEAGQARRISEAAPV